MKLVWNNCKRIGEVIKSERTKLVVELVARDGVKYINIRGWYIRKRDNEWRPAMEGFAIPVGIHIQGELERPTDELMKLIEEALSMADDFAIEDEANAVWTPKKPRKKKE